MKKLYLIIIGLCLCTALYADMNTYIIGSGSAGGGSCLTDNFTGNNDTALEIYDSKYKSISTTYDVESYEIYGNACQAESNYNAAGAYYENSQSADPQYASCTIGTDSDWSAGRYSVCVRASTDSTGYGAKLSLPSEGNWTRLYVSKNATDKTYTLGTWSVSTPHTLYIMVEDDESDDPVISIWVDDNSGDPDHTWTDTEVDPITTGYPGFFNASSGHIHVFDDFSDCSW